MNKARKMIPRWIVFLFLFFGCKNKTPEEKFADYVSNPKNKITQVIKVGETQARLKLLTDEYRNSLVGADTVTTEGSGVYYYFNMRFDKSVGDKPDKQKTLYLDFDMQNDFVMLVNNDSVPAAICQKIENGRAGSYEYLLAFEKRNRKKEEEDFTVFYHDKIFGIGTIAFVYKQEDIKKIPALKTKTD
jgi:hypothetical protein